MSDAGWIKSGHDPLYVLNIGSFTATVIQRGEFWENRVTLLGKLVDFGLWDNRDAAFQNANGALKKFRRYHNIERYAPHPFKNSGTEDDDV